LERRDPAQAIILRNWFEKVSETLVGRILPIDTDAALNCAALFVPNPRPWRDAFIGATAFTHNFTLVTRNLRDFQGMKIELIDPWSV
ncbi:MAG: hypothetical protein KGI75_27010, partial [Rhizobiaceae bacterium]|nr:hypothetical protein [Rhizobiaceae bacterium]